MEECMFPQRRRDAELSAEKTNGGDSRPPFDFIRVLCAYLSVSASLRGIDLFYLHHL
jgi:hypothetical protein